MPSSEQQPGRSHAGGAVAALRERAAGIDPLILAAGAAAAGAAVGAFVPRSDAETQLLAPIGARVNAAAGALGNVARQALSAELATVPVVGPIVAEKIDSVLDPIVDADPDTAEPVQPATAD